MTVETATKIEQLDSTLPASSNNITEGDNHLRLIKSVLKTAFSFALASSIGKFVRVKSDATGFEAVALGSAAYLDTGTASGNVVTKGAADDAYAPKTHVTNYANPHQVTAAQIGAANILTQLKTVDGDGSGLDADLLGGKDNSEFWNTTNLPIAAGVSTASSAATTNFPIGQQLIVQTGGVSLDRRGSATVYLYANAQYYTLSSAGGAEALSGVWRSCGRIGDYYLMQRVS